MMERLICLECGNQKNFIREEYLREFATRTVYLDKYGECEDENYDYHDCEVIDEYPIRCATCNSEKIEKVEEEDFDFFVWKHTDKEGKWHKEELEKEKRDMAVYDMLLAERL